MIVKILKKKIFFWVGLMALGISLSFLIYSRLNLRLEKSVKEFELRQNEAEREVQEFVNNKIKEVKEVVLVEEPVFIPPNPPDMERMKNEGCVADGLLSGYGKSEKRLMKLINRSNCYYLHRAIETWLESPNFKEVEKLKAKIKKEDVVFGMFIAEAIDTKAKYFYDNESRDFNFSKMCRLGSKNNWGEHTCKPSFKKEEYRKYVKDITEKAMDLGVQSFMFGQVYYQDYISNSDIDEVIDNMRAYAKSKGMEIVIGAQTNDIEDEGYLRKFDFIEGGVGINIDGKIEEGPCFSRWWKKEGDWCWALLWNDKFFKKANNVFVHLDWSGVKGDDMSIFTNMSRKKRAETLRYLHGYFEKKETGFLMPMFTALAKENGGCHGKSRKFYSADNKYSCKDEDVINELLEEVE